MTLASCTAAVYVTFLFAVKMYPSVYMTVFFFYLAEALVHYFKWLTDCSGKINSNFKKKFQLVSFKLCNITSWPHGGGDTTRQTALLCHFLYFNPVLNIRYQYYVLSLEQRKSNVIIKAFLKFTDIFHVLFWVFFFLCTQKDLLFPNLSKCVFVSTSLPR